MGSREEKSDRTPRFFRVAVVSLAIFLAPLRPALAQPPAPDASLRVVLLAPRFPDDRAKEALVRVRGELVAAGFSPIGDVHEAGGDPREAVEKAVREFSALAALAVVYRTLGESGPPTVELWVSERTDGRTTVQRLTLSKDGESRDSTKVAVYAVDLLKATLSEFWNSPREKRQEDAPSASPPPSVVPPSPWWTRLGVGAGAMAVIPIRKSPRHLLPQLRILASTPRERWTMGLSIAGFGTSGQVDARTGSARLSEGYATVGLSFAPIDNAWISPVALSAVGVNRLAIAGDGDSPNSGRSGAAWSAVGQVELGGRLRLGKHLRLVAATGLLLRTPRTAVFIDDVEAARVGGPSLVVEAWLEGRFQ